MNRALRAATTGVLLLSPLALSACSAGQVTQTATQERDKVGALAAVGDITLRAANLVHPDGGLYEAGDDAELTVAIVNSTPEADTLVEVSGEGFDAAEISPADGQGSELEIPGRSTVFVGQRDAASITLTGLDEPLTTGRYVELVLTFENAGEVTMLVPVGTPDRVLERGEGFDFHDEEAGAEESAEGDGGH
ncbi:copper chaperone PCu(A)C [Blastococcus saxobsidens]|uniref:Copper(I)-binding protein n=1 Tax=Blastococcus saxobsidens TaxID=138336 RepID=A0A4Q7YDB5_9ACTN|nr:copper chaperone PCu(A)C [Blastococcus saxobsidens]RZU34321.1 copper(I)-binding protein [Blastococcus saxobsidens]